MSQNRSRLVDILTAEFTDPDKKEKCLKAKSKLMRADQRFRIFDEFPCLLPPEELKLLNNRCRKILRQIKSIRTTSTGLQLASVKDMLYIRQLQKDIARTGCSDLLDEHGDIRQDVRKVLGWDVALSQEQITDLLRAYVAAINQAMLENIGRQFERSSNSLSGFCDSINRNYSKWTEQVFREFTNPAVRKEWRDNRAQILAGGVKPRVFDELACLLTLEDSRILGRRFRAILDESVSIRRVLDPNEDFELINDSGVLKKLEKDIAAISCGELLDEHGGIKLHIQQMLEWDEALDKENMCEVVMDHVYAINQLILREFTGLSPEQEAALRDIREEIMKNYPQWTAEVLKECGFIEEDNSLLKIGIGVGAGVLALASLAGVMLFHNYPALDDKSAVDKSRQHTPRP